MFRDCLLGLIGGLGFFLFGMQLMSEALRKVAGDRLKKIIHSLTKTPIIGVLLGASITALIQSSSATTVMIVGLVNAGLLTLRQAIGVIMGANIGTTFTAWLVSFLAVFKISYYALPAVGIGFLISVIGKSRRTRLWGQALLDFGILFMGLAILKDGFQSLENSQKLKDIFIHFARYPILGVLVGTIMTIILQSSSATIAIVQLWAFNGLIGFQSAIPLILGDNIGTTIKANIASLGANIAAKRTARVHTIFNVVGVCYILIFVYTGLYAKFVELIVPGEITRGNIMLHIAVAHSAFNIFNTLVFLPFIGKLEAFVIKLIPGKPDLLETTPTYLEKHLLDTPPLALEQSTKEIVRMLKIAKKGVNSAVESLFTGNAKMMLEAHNKEDATDHFQHEIGHYLIELSQRNLSPEESEELPVLLHSINDIERIGDHAVNLVELAERKVEQKISFSGAAEEEMKIISKEVNSMIDEVAEAFEKDDIHLAKAALRREEILNRYQIDFRKTHVARLNEGKSNLLAGLIFLDFIDNMEKIGDHLTNVAQSILGGLRWESYHIEPLSNDSDHSNEDLIHKS